MYGATTPALPPPVSACTPRVVGLRQSGKGGLFGPSWLFPLPLRDQATVIVRSFTSNVRPERAGPVGPQLVADKQ